MILSKLKNLAKEMDRPTMAFYLIHRVLSHLPGLALQQYYIVAQPVTPKPWLPARRGKDILVEKVAVDDLRLGTLPLSQAVLRYRQQQGAICFAAFQNNVAIGCLWLCFNEYQEDEVRCRYILTPADRYAWDFDVYLTPEHRLGIAFLKLWDTANDFLHARGATHSLSRISAFNPKSLGSHKRLGAVVVGRLTFAKIGKIQIMRSSVAPNWHLSLSANHSPEINLSHQKIHA